MSRLVRVEHLARIEGHAGITVELDGRELGAVRFDVVEGARLLEGLVRGRRCEDVAPIVSRICAICSVAHALASVAATEAALGVVPTPQTARLRDLLLRGENIASHALHVFLLAAPDYLGFPSAPAMAEAHPEAVALGLRLKKLGNEIQDAIGGRAIHPNHVVPGGFARLPEVGTLVALRDALGRAAEDADTALAFVQALPRVELAASDTVYAAVEPPEGYGYGPGERVVFLADGLRHPVEVAELPAVLDERAVPWSHAKHSGFGGRPVMVGALARFALFGDRLGPEAAAAARALGLRRDSTNPIDNNLAQTVELVHDLAAAAADLDLLLAEGLHPERPVPVVGRAGTGTAVLEAPRGLLAHRYRYDGEGRIEAAEVITPTAVNAASVEDRFRRFVAADPERGDDGLRDGLERIARAYDPCVSCSVHLVRRRSPVG